MIPVVAAIIHRNNTYFLARRAPHKIHAGKWEFPGGKIEQGETPESALKRELFEEFGIACKVGPHVLSNQFDYGAFQIELMAYEVTCLSHDFELKDHDQIAWLRLEEFENYDLSEADVAIWQAL